MIVKWLIFVILSIRRGFKIMLLAHSYAPLFLTASAVLVPENRIVLKPSLRECSKTPSYGKITIENKSNEIIRVSLIPAISWNYHEKRTNNTILRQPDKAFGGNHIRLVKSLSIDYSIQTIDYSILVYCPMIHDLFQTKS